MNVFNPSVDRKKLETSKAVSDWDKLNDAVPFSQYETEDKKIDVSSEDFNIPTVQEDIGHTAVSLVGSDLLDGALTPAIDVENEIPSDKHETNGQFEESKNKHEKLENEKRDQIFSDLNRKNNLTRDAIIEVMKSIGSYDKPLVNELDLALGQTAGSRRQSKVNMLFSLTDYIDNEYPSIYSKGTVDENHRTDSLIKYREDANRDRYLDAGEIGALSDVIEPKNGDKNAINMDRFAVSRELNKLAIMTDHFDADFSDSVLKYLKSPSQDNRSELKKTIDNYGAHHQETLFKLSKVFVSPNDLANNEYNNLRDNIFGITELMDYETTEAEEDTLTSLVD